MGTKSGTNGPDVYKGSNGNNKYFGLDGNDKINGAGGDDKLYGDAGKDQIMGGAGDDYLFGGADNDTLNGAKGDDKLYGGMGLDRLTGGSGADHFYFKGNETGDFTDGLADRITDFNGAEGDRIRLRDVTGFDGNTAAPSEGHYGIWNNGGLGWVVTYKEDGEYHDIAVGLQDPTGFVFSY